LPVLRLKALRPAIKVIGVEPDEAPCMYEALRHGRRVKLPQVGIFADGVAVRQAGKEPFRVARQYVDEVITVTTDEICAAMKDIFDDCRAVVSRPARWALPASRSTWKPAVRDQCLWPLTVVPISIDRLRRWQSVQNG
jgi:threonine dehydratase